MKGNTPQSFGLKGTNENNGIKAASTNDFGLKNIPANDPVVDTRNLPSGLPRAIDDAIGGAYRNASPGLSNRVRKGFQAVMTKDWKVAKAWFQDALQLDPNNEGLKKFIVLCDYTLGTKPVNNTISEKIPVPVIFTYVPTSDEIKAYEGNMKAIKEAEKNGFLSLPNEASVFSDNFWKYVYSLDVEGVKKFDAFCKYTTDIKNDKNLPIKKIPVPVTATYMPTSDEIKAFQANNRLLEKDEFWKPLTIPPGGFSEKFKKYIYSLSEDEMKKFLSIQLPEEKDIELLFPMTLPPVSKSKVPSNKN